MLKYQKDGSGSSSKSDFFRLLNRFVTQEVHPEEVDLIFPVLDEELEFEGSFSLDQLNNIINLYD